MSKTITLDIDNTNTGDYTATIYIGSERVACKVILDTGSSTLAIGDKVYDSNTDNDAQSTDLYQVAQYGSGSWSGPVIRTSIDLADTNNESSLNNVDLAIAKQSTNMFNQCDGILGLAYQSLNGGIYKMSDDDSGYVETSKTLQPYFTQLEENAVVANKFSFYTRRSVPSETEPNLNKGLLILGGGEERTDLYSGDFQCATITHDQYYNVNLKSISVGDQSPITVAAASSVNEPNCIVDSGTNGVVFPTSVYHDVISQFYSFDSAIGDLLSKALNNNGSLYRSALDLAKWPVITFTLQGDSGDIHLDMKPKTYWQETTSDIASLRFFGASAPSILGLPLMNNYFCIFDRSADRGLGQIKFAAIK
jgi:Eukaryotic aspartyl protease